jgi:DNA-binding response OmpR family regulator
VTEGPRVLLVSDDDDVAGPLEALLRRAGCRVGVRGGGEAAQELRGAPADTVVLDRDLPGPAYREVLEALQPYGGRASFPLIVLGRSTAEEAAPLPSGWHEDAARTVARPPQAGELLATLEALRRLAFYRRYRDLVHDLSQPVTTLHALSRSLARLQPPDEAGRQAIERLGREADRLMRLMEDFQRTRGASGP